MSELSLHDFPLKTYDKIRYADTDRCSTSLHRCIVQFRVELISFIIKKRRSIGSAFFVLV